MKKQNNKYFEQLKIFVRKISLQSTFETLKYFNTNLEGLSLAEARKRIKIHGKNIFDKKKNSLIAKIIEILFNPFNIILLIVMFFSFLQDVYFSKEERDYSTLIVIIFVLFLSNIMHFIQSAKFSKITEKLKKVVQTTSTIKRDKKIYKIPLDDIVVGDIIYLSSGDIVPADVKLFETKDFFVKETFLTGENEPIEKNSICLKKYENILEDKRIVFMGTNVVSGYAKGIVISKGNSTYLGQINKFIIQKKPITTLQKEINSIVKLLSFCVLIIFCLIFILNFFKHSDNFQFLDVFLFSLTITLGITPEMLPLIVTTSFLTGVYSLSKKNVIVKNLYSIQDFGSMNFLFTDKTGTLTEDSMSVENYFNLNNMNDKRVLEYSFLNSYFQTKIKSSIDLAIIDKMNKILEKTPDEINFHKKFVKNNEIPFDFKRRIVSVILDDNSQYKKIITKGAIEEILNICESCEFFDSKNNNKKIISLDKEKILKNTIFYNQKGFRVIGVAYKNISKDIFDDNIINNYEKNMIFIGFLTLFDKPKKTAKKAIYSLKNNGVKVKILTGDNEVLSKMIASKIQIDNSKECLSGYEIDKMDDEELYTKLLNIDILFKLNPEQKSRIVSVFKNKNNIVGFMGDGINDAPAMQIANLSISVDSGVDIAKESADIILLSKDLNVLKDAILESRKIYNNMMKYIKFTLSSNFGNILSVLVAFYFLKFVPLLPIQILFLNLIYDFSCLALPFDNVDSRYLRTPRKWNLKKIINFMFLFGFIAFIFDLLFCFGLYFIYQKINYNFFDDPITFRTSWFIFSIFTQILTILILRTDNFIKDSKISIINLLFLFFGGIFAVFLVSIEFFSSFLYFKNIFNLKYIIFLILLLFFYGICLIFAKNIFIKKNKELL
ncbi:magnesium-translocating P-type ATPase [Texas Phoenix palm phytoplasma]|uniref:Magnesium-transporting ATPase, P-type 1 n=2 Tax=Texas Phoenix palm phytoplasma TaxID=176709 RepID=A0ABS5BIX9_9MOLU|nr:magnesium-translocating P-type ATPase [Texas Phoenix palm phytoplasma]